MRIDLPGRQATFADSSKTEGGGLLGKYVLAQFRADAEMTWLRQLRSQLGSSELKYKHFRERRQALRKNRDLWKAVEQGMSQATIVVTDPEPVAAAVRQDLSSQGAEEGIDFGDPEIHERCAHSVISGTPIAHLEHELNRMAEQGIYDADLAPVLGNAFGCRLERTYGSELTFGRARAALGAVGFEDYTSSIGGQVRTDFSPSAIRERIGSGMRPALAFATRVNATFDPAAMDESISSTRDAFRSPMSRTIMNEVMSTERVFDEEDSSTIEILNEASEASRTSGESFERQSQRVIASEQKRLAPHHVHRLWPGPASEDR